MIDHFDVTQQRRLAQEVSQAIVTAIRAHRQVLSR